MNAALKGLKVGETDCKDCSEIMKNGEIGVECHHHTKTETYHPNCFRCETCRQLLVDNIYFFYKDKYYCGRHYADQLYPRCAGCDEVYFISVFLFLIQTFSVNFRQRIHIRRGEIVAFRSFRMFQMWLQVGRFSIYDSRWESILFGMLSEIVCKGNTILLSNVYNITIFRHVTRVNLK